MAKLGLLAVEDDHDLVERVAASLTQADVQDDLARAGGAATTGNVSLSIGRVVRAGGASRGRISSSASPRFRTATGISTARVRVFPDVDTTAP